MGQSGAKVQGVGYSVAGQGADKIAGQQEYLSTLLPLGTRCTEKHCRDVRCHLVQIHIEVL